MNGVIYFEHEVSKAKDAVQWREIDLTSDENPEFGLYLARYSRPQKKNVAGRRNLVGHFDMGNKDVD